MKKSKLILLASFVFVFNLIWEFLHSELYLDLTGIPPITHLILASFTDLFLVFFIFLINSFLRKKITWIESPKKFDYLVLIIFGILISVIIEIYSLSMGRWAYKETMPMIFGIGLSPLVQLFATFIIGLFAFNFLNRIKFKKK